MSKIFSYSFLQLYLRSAIVYITDKDRRCVVDRKLQRAKEDKEFYAALLRRQVAYWMFQLSAADDYTRVEQGVVIDKRCIN